MQLKGPGKHWCDSRQDSLMTAGEEHVWLLCHSPHPHTDRPPVAQASEMGYRQAETTTAPLSADRAGKKHADYIKLLISACSWYHLDQGTSKNVRRKC